MRICIDIRHCEQDDYRKYFIETVLTEVLKAPQELTFFLLANTNKPPLKISQKLQTFYTKTTIPALRKTGWWQRRAANKIIKETRPDLLISFPESHIQNRQGKEAMIIGSDHVDKKDLKKIAGGLSAVGFTTGYLKDFFSKKIQISEDRLFAFEGVYQKPRRSNKIFDKEKFTDGKEFFICTDADLTTDSLVHLLKAFSIFKKRQQSNWKLVIGCRNEAISEVLKPTLEKYKFRDDVIAAYSNEIEKLLPEAYGLISVSTAEIFPVPVFEAHSVQTPVVAHHTKTLQEITAEAVLFASSYSPEALAEEMMFLYKDEAYKDRLLQSVPLVLERINPANALAVFRSFLQKAMD